MAKHHDNVDQQFGDQANAYLTSAVHAGGRDLLRLGERLSTESKAVVLDLGCGGATPAMLLHNMPVAWWLTIFPQNAGSGV